ncbi:MAG: deoxyguanosinetriphosphate triphosphohydrolase [Taibaiella sp.]|nr:deoxyguanosinetriphosphate triphosphohydrolase [Taibaiella sp.]
MNWQTLYSAQRTGDKEERKPHPDQLRTSFLRDYDRIIFSSAFRRLQNKTQVFPLPGAVFVHNRLTHSLEVACVGRSFGQSVGNALAQKYSNESADFKEFYKYELSSVIAAACLAHDIGNPPFGHSGEDAIRTFFRDLDPDTKKILHEELSANQIADLENFEGNSNAFRVLTHSYNENEAGGYRLTYTTLAAIVKYPSSSQEGFSFKKSGLIATKKSGYFDTESDTFKAIADALGVPVKEGYSNVYARHPFVYLTEAADDICYRVIDLEDAHRLHITSLQKIKELFLPFFEKETGYNSVAYLARKIDNINDDNQKVQYIRARWIGLMVDKLTNAFMENEAALLGGTLEKDLMKCLPADDRKFIEAINEYSVKHVYNYKAVVEIEIAGFNVIGGLLREFITAVLQPEHARSKKLLQLVSTQFPITKGERTLYQNVLSIVDFISGMTDLYAIDIYRKITGITIPELR